MEKPVGLILAGGESKRMGTAKAWIDYHGMPQVEWLSHLIDPYCSAIIVSMNDIPFSPYEIPFEPDLPAYAGYGPISGVLTAFEKTNQALLVVGCDYPYLNREAIEKIIQARNEECDITCFINKKGFIEPLIACYEYKVAVKLKSFFQRGNDSLNQFIKANQSQLLNCPDPNILYSADTPDFKFDPNKSIK
jgi:molybdopterin-guanine dinucleotide biosynthesis protein A